MTTIYAFAALAASLIGAGLAMTIGIAAIPLSVGIGLLVGFFVAAAVNR